VRTFTYAVNLHLLESAVDHEAAREGTAGLLVVNRRHHEFCVNGGTRTFVGSHPEG